jgi:hypothetical protein
MNKDNPSGLKDLLKTSVLSAAFLVLLLSLATWYFFYARSMPLTTGDIAVVVVFWLTVVVVGKWVLGRISLRRENAANEKKKADISGAPSSNVAVPGCPSRALAFAMFLFCVFRPISAAAQPSSSTKVPLPSQSPSFDISCSPQKPIAEIGSIVRLRAFVDSAQAQTPRYAWTVSTGSIQGSGLEVQWNLAGGSSGFNKATVTVVTADAKSADCSVQVIATEPERGERPMERETTRAFLPKGQKEEAGYGLYSYLLLGSAPTDASRVRCLSAIEAYLTLMLPLDDLQDIVAHNKLNITYLPVRTSPPPHPSPQWLLDNYDFARARVLLDLLPGLHRQGPYLVSTLFPLSSSDPLSSRYLFQDLSTIPTDPKDLVSWWILEFQNQAAQERFWEPRTVESLALRIRTTISVLATGLPEVQKQVATWIAWSK